MLVVSRPAIRPSLSQPRWYVVTLQESRGPRQRQSLPSESTAMGVVTFQSAKQLEAMVNFRLSIPPHPADRVHKIV